MYLHGDQTERRTGHNSGSGKGLAHPLNIFLCEQLPHVKRILQGFGNEALYLLPQSLMISWIPSGWKYRSALTGIETKPYGFE